MSEKSRCSNCDIELEDNITNCPSCNKMILDQPEMPDVDLEGFESDQPEMPDVDLDGFESDQPEIPDVNLDGFESDQPEIPDVDLDGFESDQPEIPDVNLEGFESDQPEMPDINIEGFDDDNKEDIDLDFLDTSTENADLDFLDAITDTSTDEGLDFLDSVIESAESKEEKSEISTEDLEFLDSVIETTEPVEQVIEAKTEKITDDEIPDLPDFDELVSDSKDEDVEIKEKIMVNGLSSLSITGQLRLFLPQWSYWFIIFALISFTSLEVINPNFDPLKMKYEEDYSYRNIFMLISWISFVVMGFYFRHTLSRKEIDPHTKYMVLFLIGQYIYIYVLSIVGLILFNPQLLSGVYLKYNYFITAFFVFIAQNFIISFLSFGVVGIFLGYNVLWKYMTPVSKSVTSN